MRSVNAVRAELDERFGDIFGFAGRVVEENQVHADFWRGKENEACIVLYHFAKAVNLLDATRTLCHDGFAKEAIAHLPQSVQPFHQSPLVDQARSVFQAS